MKTQKIQKSKLNPQYIINKIKQQTKYESNDLIDRIDFQSIFKILNQRQKLKPFDREFIIDMWQLCYKYRCVNQEKKVTISNLVTTTILKTIQSTDSNQQRVSKKLCEIFNVQFNENKSFISKMNGLTIVAVLTGAICCALVKIKNIAVNHNKYTVDTIRQTKMDTIGDKKDTIISFLDGIPILQKFVQILQNCVRFINIHNLQNISFAWFKKKMIFSNKYLWVFLSAGLLLAIYFKNKHYRQKPKSKDQYLL